MRRYRPFLLSLAVIVLDQVSKALIVHFIPEGSVAVSLFSGFLWICHVRNDAVAFSFGSALPDAAKYALFVALPAAVLAAIGYMIASRKAEKETTAFQRWCLAGIVGGGAGNLRDACGVVGHGGGIVRTGHHAAAGAAAEGHASGAPFGDGKTFGVSAGNGTRHQPEGKQGCGGKSGLTTRGTKDPAHHIERYVHEFLESGCD